MDITQLFEMQRALDAYIQSNRKEQTDVFREKGLALLVELGELANETRCFKFWSKKGPSDRPVILEEYVDSIHFMLSLGLARNLESMTTWPAILKEEQCDTLTEQFLSTYEAVQQFLREPNETTYAAVWRQYDGIATHLQFTNEEIVRAYIEKNEENYERQRTGY